MIEVETLDRNVNELKEWMTSAWRCLAESRLTSFERGELRNEMKLCSAKIRRCLQLLESERGPRIQFPEICGSLDFETWNFRLLGQIERTPVVVSIKEEVADAPTPATCSGNVVSFASERPGRRAGATL